MRTEENTLDECLDAKEMVAYLKGGLDTEVEKLVDAHLSDCELCCESLEALEADGPEDAMSLENLVSSEVTYKEQLNKENGPTTAPGNNVRSLSVKSILGVAASVLLLATAAFFLIDLSRSAGSEELLATYLVPYEDLVSTRSGGDERTIIDLAMILYNQGAYAQAADDFDEVLEGRQDDDLLKLYAGISHLMSNNSGPATKLFVSISKGDGAFNEIADWYLGLLYLKDGEPDLAKEQFQKVVDGGGEFSKQAQEILKEMN